MIQAKTLLLCELLLHCRVDLGHVTKREAHVGQDEARDTQQLHHRISRDTKLCRMRLCIRELDYYDAITMAPRCTNS